MKTLDNQITNNFNLNEFKCRHCSNVILNEGVLDHINRLQEFREWYGRPMIINSGYRCKVHNQKVGGVTGSLHLKGIAVDFNLPKEYYSFTNKRKNEFIKNIKNKWESLGGGAFIIYDTFIHLDSRKGFVYIDNRKGT